MPDLPTRFAGLILAFTALFVHRSWRHAQLLLIGAILTRRRPRLLRPAVPRRDAPRPHHGDYPPAARRGPLRTRSAPDARHDRASAHERRTPAHTRPDPRNPATLDFVSMPTHAYQEGEATSAAEALDAYAEADDVPTQSLENGDDLKRKKRAATKQNPARRRVRRRS